MIDFYLRFNDEATAKSVLYTTTLEVTDENGVVVQEGSVKPNFANIDIIGTIYKPTGEFTFTEGSEISTPVMEALDGFHVNVRALDGEETSFLSPYSVIPANPRRVWG